jgi:hypothetical protein
MRGKWRYIVAIGLLAAGAGLAVHYQSLIRFKLLTLNPDLYLSFDCNIMTWSGELVRKFPYDYCLYSDDGSMIASYPLGILSFDRNMKVLWQKKMHVHHKFIKTVDGRHVIFPTSEVQKFQGMPVRFDVLQMVDTSGNTVKTWRSFDFIEEIKQRAGIQNIELWPFTWDLEQKPMADWEATHLNSVSEIEDDGYFKKGDFIVNLHGPIQRFIVLSRDFSKIVWMSRRNHYVHDVQVLKSGNILLFRNRPDDKSKFSSLEEIDPGTELPVWRYQAESENEFFSEGRGNVQKIGDDDFYLFTDLTTQPSQAVVIDKHGHKLWSYKTVFKVNEWTYAKMRRVHLLNLGQFLRLNNI